MRLVAIKRCWKITCCMSCSNRILITYACLYLRNVDLEGTALWQRLTMIDLSIDSSVTQRNETHLPPKGRWWLVGLGYGFFLSRTSSNLEIRLIYCTFLVIAMKQFISVATTTTLRDIASKCIQTQLASKGGELTVPRVKGIANRSLLA